MSIMLQLCPVEFGLTLQLSEIASVDVRCGGRWPVLDCGAFVTVANSVVAQVAIFERHFAMPFTQRNLAVIATGVEEDRARIISTLTQHSTTSSSSLSFHRQNVT